MDRNPNCPQDLDRIFMRCLEKDPADRWPSFDALRLELVAAHERLTGLAYSSRTLDQFSPEEVANQFRSLTVLEGYDQAIQRSHLRRGQDSSPYAFHLALASYFHCNQQPEEERRQLEKAKEVRPKSGGYEVTRRLGDLLVDMGELDKAERLMKGFLESNPDGLDQCLEPYIELLIARGCHDEAIRTLDKASTSLRTNWLRSRVFRAAERHEELEPLLEHAVERIGERIESLLTQISDASAVGWEFVGDGDHLDHAAKVLWPDLDLSPLNAARHTVWPDLNGHPDFAPPLAWLSDVVGQLAELREDEALDKVAQRLDYPNRLATHLMRDEYWFWAQETPPDPEA